MEFRRAKWRHFARFSASLHSSPPHPRADSGPLLRLACLLFLFSQMHCTSLPEMKCFCLFHRSPSIEVTTPARSYFAPLAALGVRRPIMCDSWRARDANLHSPLATSAVDDPKARRAAPCQCRLPRQGHVALGHGENDGIRRVRRSLRRIPPPFSCVCLGALRPISRSTRPRQHRYK